MDAGAHRVPFLWDHRRILGPITSVSLPALTDVFGLTVASPESLTTLETPLLEIAADVVVDCDLASGGATPLSVLDLGSLGSARSVEITDCTDLAQCSVDADLAGATIGFVNVYGLDATCTCDAQGDVQPGSCADG